MNHAQPAPMKTNGRCTNCNDYARDCSCRFCPCGGSIEQDGTTCNDCEKDFCSDCQGEIYFDEVACKWLSMLAPTANCFLCKGTQ
jgi:hypothetical protein